MATHHTWKMLRNGVAKWSFSPTQHHGCANWTCGDCGNPMCFGSAQELIRARKMSGDLPLLCYPCRKNHEEYQVSKALNTKRCLFCMRTVLTEVEWVRSVCTFCHDSLKKSFEERSLEMNFPTTIGGFKKWLFPGPPPFSDFPLCSCNSCRHAGLSMDNEAH